MVSEGHDNAAHGETGSCPNRDQLRKLSQGLLPEPDIQQLAQHLGQCSRCQTLLQSLDELSEGFQSGLRQASRSDALLSEPQFGKLMRRAQLIWSPKPSEPQHSSVEAPLPRTIGRYVVRSQISVGSFSRVYLADDPELRRAVAVKVPRQERTLSPRQIDAFIHEARAVAALRHERIVPIYDVGRREDGTPYLVVEYIDGQSLDQVILTRRFPISRCVRVLTEVAQAVHYAHQQGYVHRDLKPANVLLDQGGQVFVTDFGLAVQLSDEVTVTDDITGSPAYMAPEQVRGENHRVDARTDIWALGVMLYEMLSGTRPFAGDGVVQLFDQIQHARPISLRELNPSASRQLDRICRRCLAKRMSDRYESVAELLGDLQHWKSQGEISDFDRPATGVSFVPKGLRHFEAEDADSYLQLLPGPRDQQGLPRAVRFWKARLDSTQDGSAPSVAVVYGPSGCGKSSLVKAGILPQLSDHVTPVYVQATAHRTEKNLAAALRHCCRDLPSHLDLSMALAAIRQKRHVRPTRKVLIVLDQFEQWLHHHPIQEGGPTELAQALRQCNCEVACLLVVRDEFWMPLTRFMQQLEIPIIEGTNAAAVDRFSSRHAKNVLTALGRSCGTLPAQESSWTQDHHSFLDKAIDYLSEDGQVICVQLVMFAEAVRTQPWVTSTLKQIEQRGGLGNSFFDNYFTSKTAPPEYGRHCSATQAVLQALLPEPGEDIKGRSRTRLELQQVAGYSNRSDEFASLLSILDQQLHLITPVHQPDNISSNDRNEERRYQLTHDFLVPALRTWLQREQLGTRHGRARVRLKTRAKLWYERPESKQLPTLREWLNIACSIRASERLPQEQKMLRAARRYHLLRLSFLALASLLLVCVAGQWLMRDRAAHFHARLLEARTADVPALVQQFGLARRWLDPMMIETLGQPGLLQHKRLPLALALVGTQPDQLEFVKGYLTYCDPDEVMAICEVLTAEKEDLGPRQWRELCSELRQSITSRDTVSGIRMRAACALAQLEPASEPFCAAARPIVDALLEQLPTDVTEWLQLLSPVGAHLTETLESTLRDEPSNSRRYPALLALLEFYSDDAEKLVEVSPLVNLREIRLLVRFLEPHRDSVIAHLRPRVQQLEAELTEVERQNSEILPSSLPEECAKLTLILARLRDYDTLWPLLRNRPHPGVRSLLIEHLDRSGVPSGVLLRRIDAEPVASVRSALLLALGEYDHGDVSRDNADPFLARLRQTYLTDPTPGVHSAAGWLLREWGDEQWLRELRSQLGPGDPRDERRWYVNTAGQCMAIIGPSEFWMGAGPVEIETHKEGLARHRRRVDRTVAISTTEVTLRQFLELMPSHDDRHDFSVGPASERDCPVNMVSHADAMLYCLRLSESEDIPEDQWCYEYREIDGVSKIFPRGEFLSLGGYRLPTEGEWELACRAGTNTSRFTGTDESVVTRYGWCSENAQKKTWPVGRLRPNPWGFFDVYGNLFEMCQDRDYQLDDTDERVEDVLHYGEDQLVVVRGHHYRSAPKYVNSYHRSRTLADGERAIGFRIARSVRR